MMSENKSYEDGRARPVGRVLRLLTGGALLAVVIDVSMNASGIFLLQAASVVIGLTALYTVIHFTILKLLTSMNRFLGAVIALVPVVAVYLGLGGAGQIGALTYIGISLVVDATRADLGCEVMALPGLIFRRRTHLPCLVFCPIDWLEEKLRGRA